MSVLFTACVQSLHRYGSSPGTVYDSWATCTWNSAEGRAHWDDSGQGQEAQQESLKEAEGCDHSGEDEFQLATGTWSQSCSQLVTLESQLHRGSLWS